MVSCELPQSVDIFIPDQIVPLYVTLLSVDAAENALTVTLEDALHVNVLQEILSVCV